MPAITRTAGASINSCQTLDAPHAQRTATTLFGASSVIIHLFAAGFAVSPAGPQRSGGPAQRVDAVSIAAFPADIRYPAASATGSSVAPPASYLASRRGPWNTDSVPCSCTRTRRFT